MVRATGNCSPSLVTAFLDQQAKQKARVEHDWGLAPLFAVCMCGVPGTFLNEQQM